MYLLIRILLIFFIVNFNQSNGFIISLKSPFFVKINAITIYAKEVKVTNLDNGNIIEIPSGSPLSLAAVRSGMRLSFQCKAGTCGSCVSVLDGKKVFTCQTKVPDKASIKIKKKSWNKPNDVNWDFFVWSGNFG